MSDGISRPRRRTRNGWAVVYESGSSKSCHYVSRVRAVAVIYSLLNGGKVVNHDAEMRRWGYEMGIIEPTPEERRHLPAWHENYETVPPRSASQKTIDDDDVARYRANSHVGSTCLTWEQWMEYDRTGSLPVWMEVADS